MINLLHSFRTQSQSVARLWPVTVAASLPRAIRLLLPALALGWSSGALLAQAPANDAFADRIEVLGFTNTVAGSSLNGSREAGEPAHLGATNGASVWWTWTAPADGAVSIDTAGSAFDTILSVYTGGSLGNLSLIGENDDNGAGSTSRVTFTAQRGTTYQVAVDGFSGASGTVSLTVELSADESEPVFLQNVRNQTAFIPPPSTQSVPVLFSVSAAGFPPPAIQWFRDGVLVPGGTNSSLGFNATTNDAGASFTVVLSNLVNVVTSSVAVLQTVQLAFNDQFADRIAIVPGSNEVPATDGNVTVYRLLGSATGAGKETGEPDHAGHAGGTSTWWTWTAPRNGSVSLDTRGTDFDTLLAVYQGNAVNGLSVVVQNDDDAAGTNTTSAVTFSATAGTTYQIAVDAKSSPGAVVLNLRYEIFNDHFADRKIVTGQSIQSTGKNGAATRETGEPLHAGNAGGGSLWWSWTAPSNGPVTLHTDGSAIDTLLGVYTGSAVGALTPLVANNNDGTNSSSRVRFAAVAGTEYQIAVDGWSDGTNHATGGVTLNLVQWPDNNDLFAGRQPLLGQSVSVSGSNVGGGVETGEPTPVAGGGTVSTWWSWVAPADGPTTIDTAGSSFDTLLAVYRGNALGSLSLVAVNDDDGSLRTSRLSFDATVGTEYQISVDGFQGATGSISLNLVQTRPMPPGGNDNFVDRYPLAGLTNSATGLNTAATEESGEPDHAESRGGASVWWKWTAPSNGIVTFNTAGSDFNTTLAAYTGGSVGTLQLIGSDDDNGGNLASRLSFVAIAGVEYQIVVDGFQVEGGPPVTRGNILLSFSLNTDPISIPNDNFANRTAISGTNQVIIASNIGATREGNEPSHGNMDTGASLWWTWTAPQNGPVQLDTVASRFDTILAVYTGTNLMTLTLLEEHDDTSAAADVTFDKSRITFEAVAGEQYQIAVDGYRAVGEVILTLRQAADSVRAPVFVRQPHAQVRFTGGQGGSGPAVFRVNVLGSRPLSYQWLRDGTAIPSATNHSYTIASPTAGDAATYSVTVSNSVAEVTSSEADLIVLASPFNDDFADRITIAGSQVTTHGTPSGGTRETAEPNHVTRTEGASVWWRWVAPSNGLVRIETTGSTFDTTLAVYTGTAVDSLSLVTENDDIDRNTVTLSSALLFNAVSGTEYAIVVDGFKTNFADETIYLKLTQPPVAPQVSVVNQAGGVRVGDNLLLSVSAVGIHPNSSYQWYQGPNLLSGATNSILQLNGVSRTNDGLYSVVVSNLGGIVQQAVGQVSVRAVQVLEMPTLLPNGNVRLRFRDVDETLATDLSRFEIHSTDNPAGANTVWTTNTSGISIGSLVETNDLGQAETNRYLLFEQSVTGMSRRYFRVIEK